jgi:methenyltetrahydromethanopterin cyclohydrolase
VLVKRVAADCGVPPSDLTILYAPTGSLAGSVQIVSRVLEVALHKAHELHFPLEHIEDGVGTAPIAPPIPDFIKAMGRTNDAIIYGGRVQLYVRGPDDAARKLAENLPSRASPAYGKPFAEIFAAVNGDFYKIDPMLFSPAAVTVSNLDTGSSFHAGELAAEIVDESFR